MNVAVIFLLVAVSGNPVFSALGKELLYPFLFFLLLTRYALIKRRVSSHDLFVFFIFFLISIGHFVAFGDVIVPSALGFLLKLGIAFLVVKLVPEFLTIFPMVMVKLTLLSFVFYVPGLFGVDLADFLSALRLPIEGLEVNHIGIHNFHLVEERGRNSGMFWEPGAFAGYLVLALVFISLKKERTFSRDALIILLGVLTTQSTTGYFALVIVLVIFLLQSRWLSENSLGKLFLPWLIFGVFFLSYGLYEVVPFMKEKVDKQFETTELEQDGFEINRFGNFLHDTKLIEERPLLGWSARKSVRGVDEDIMVAQGNGLSGFALNYGTLGIALYLSTVWLGFRRLFRSELPAVLVVFCVAVLLFGEQFLNYPLFLVLFFCSSLKAPLKVTLKD